MKTIDQLLDELIAREGGYVNHPNDPGGETNWGITVGVARANGYQASMRQMTRDQAKAIYRRLYWERPGYDKVATVFAKVAEELFDTGVNMGPGKAGEFLQRALNVLQDESRLTVDGAIGPATMAALNRYKQRRGTAGEAVLVKALDALQGERYIRLTEQNARNRSFIYGWLAHRVGNVR